MARELVIRRLMGFARRHVWDGAAVLLFVGGLAAGIGPVAAGAGKFLDFLTPGVAAEAADGPPQSGVAHLPVLGFEASRYLPQVLFPVREHLRPLWLQLRGGLDTRPLAMAPMKPAIAICIDDLGEDLAGTDRAMLLPKEVALSFLPYAEATPFLAQEAVQKGHAVLAHVPMEAFSPIDPGPMTLKVRAGDITQKIAWNISRVPGLVSINNHEGSRFTGDAASLAPVMQALAGRHLFFFDSCTGPDSQGIAVAHRYGLMSAGRDIFLDDTVSEAEVRLELDALVAEAKRDGVAIAIGHPHDVTLKVLALWLAQGHGVELISLPEAIRRKSGAVALAAR